jgi:hypothetical protein|tara:strand:+ start:249 stop:488 length:240 start_codon:yes stop_codon:yes gene_type:complete
MNGNLTRIKGFNDAIVGIADENLGEPKLVYDIKKMVEILVTRDEMSEEDAYDYISYNNVATCDDENQPLIIRMGNFGTS